MREEMNMLELVTKLSLAKKNLEELYDKYIKEDSEYSENRKSFVTLCRSNGLTVSGIEKNKVINDICNTYNACILAMNKYRKLLAIKEQVNASTCIAIGTENYSLAQLLAISKDPLLKNFYLDLRNRLLKDKEYAEMALKNHDGYVYTDDKVMTYIQARCKDKNHNSNGDIIEYRKEYYETTALELLDPCDVDVAETNLRIVDEIWKQAINKITEASVSIKIWVDLDSNEKEYWGLL